jgi:hypothetical protein
MIRNTHAERKIIRTTRAVERAVMRGDADERAGLLHALESRSRVATQK